MEMQNKTKLIQDDPVTCVRYIDKRFKDINKLLENIVGPFGKHHVVDSFQRFEFQARGSVHEHKIIYCNNAPRFTPDDSYSAIACIGFIDKFVSCRYDPTNPLIALQRPKHKATCYKYIKNKKTERKCR